MAEEKDLVDFLVQNLEVGGGVSGNHVNDVTQQMHQQQHFMGHHGMQPQQHFMHPNSMAHNKQRKKSPRHGSSRIPQANNEGGDMMNNGYGRGLNHGQNQQYIYANQQGRDREWADYMQFLNVPAMHGVGMGVGDNAANGQNNSGMPMQAYLQPTGGQEDYNQGEADFVQSFVGSPQFLPYLPGYFQHPGFTSQLYSDGRNIFAHSNILFQQPQYAMGPSQLMHQENFADQQHVNGIPAHGNYPAYAAANGLQGLEQTQKDAAQPEVHEQSNGRGHAQQPAHYPVSAVVNQMNHLSVHEPNGNVPAQPPQQAEPKRNTTRVTPKQQQQQQQQPQAQQPPSSGPKSWAQIANNAAAKPQQQIVQPAKPTKQATPQFLLQKPKADGSGKEAKPEKRALNKVESDGGPSSSLSSSSSSSSSASSAPVSTSGIQNGSVDQNPSFARFFVIKSYSEDDVHKAIKYNIWASTDSGNKRLDNAWKESSSKGPIYLFYSVNASGQFCGMAQMISGLDYDKKCELWAQDKWNGQFQLKWIFIKDVPNNALRHIRLENNDNKPVTNSRDTQEIFLEPGKELLRIFAAYKSKTSIMDDFGFYDKRQEQMKEKKQTEEVKPSPSSNSPTSSVPSEDPNQELPTGSNRSARVRGHNRNQQQQQQQNSQK